jgi:hypothetical protein
LTIKITLEASKKNINGFRVVEPFYIKQTNNKHSPSFFLLFLSLSLSPSRSLFLFATHNMTSSRTTSLLFVLLYIFVLVSCVSAAPDLPNLSSTVDSSSVTVSGLSSGAFMAVQMQFAYSASLRGAGIVAGGPFWCAKGSVSDALTVCVWARRVLIKLSDF